LKGFQARVTVYGIGNVDSENGFLEFIKVLVGCYRAWFKILRFKGIAPLPNQESTIIESKKPRFTYFETVA
jgi:hypothetical protein